MAEIGFKLIWIISVSKFCAYTSSSEANHHETKFVSLKQKLLILGYSFLSKEGIIPFDFNEFLGPCVLCLFCSYSYHVS